MSSTEISTRNCLLVLLSRIRLFEFLCRLRYKIPPRFPISDRTQFSVVYTRSFRVLFRFVPTALFKSAVFEMIGIANRSGKPAGQINTNLFIARNVTSFGHSHMRTTTGTNFKFKNVARKRLILIHVRIDEYNSVRPVRNVYTYILIENDL